MTIARSSHFRRSGVWRASLVLALVAILALLPSLLSTAAARVFADPGAHVGEALAGCRVASLDKLPLHGGGDHSDACRFCLGSPCAGQALVPNGGVSVTFTCIAHGRAIDPARAVPVAIEATSGWGSSWTAQAPPAFD
ncbi:MULTISPECIES: hypothetical protein [Methylosinus]|uniref:DUF2946 domain-containing protein n=1 Tax=Methylosinus trichosporium (strain ATCC 35070 / NCIMB 11131 / UNIQEM 75 / OB3b) TaxID=595536 RepID=A0A2D2D1C1_METT3|nr:MULTISPECIES: hypothetical protein [Methylosinus]ATQ68793.1 hypothetical protein CQW49_13565 [Methylosinus trichosporium OB3b]OBS51660.1 hypothetical protein A8B73_15130 [Methylosinus sp. 3S-1]